MLKFQILEPWVQWPTSATNSSRDLIWHIIETHPDKRAVRPGLFLPLGIWAQFTNTHKLKETLRNCSQSFIAYTCTHKEDVDSSVWQGEIRTPWASLEKISSKRCSSLSTQTHILWQKIRCWPCSQYGGLLRAGKIFDYWHQGKSLYNLNLKTTESAGIKYCLPWRI